MFASRHIWKDLQQPAILVCYPMNRMSSFEIIYKCCHLFPLAGISSGGTCSNRLPTKKCQRHLFMMITDIYLTCFYNKSLKTQRVPSFYWKQQQKKNKKTKCTTFKCFQAIKFWFRWLTVSLSVWNKTLTWRTKNITR